MDEGQQALFLIVAGVGVLAVLALVLGWIWSLVKLPVQVARIDRNVKALLEHQGVPVPDVDQ